MTCVIKFTETADGWLNFDEPLYLRSFDGIYGTTHLTADRSRAMRFATVGGAHAFWQSVPKVEPRRRDDGLPNRPLMAFNAEFVDVLG